jgi:type II secretory pathway component PulF
VSRACDFLPIWGRLKLARDLSYFCSALAASLDAGTPLPESLDRARGAVAGRALSRRLARVVREVREGAVFSESLSRVRGIPRTFAWAVSLGERRGGVPEVVRSFVDLYRREVESRYEVLRALASPAGILLIANFIGAFVIAPLFLPLISLMDELGMG